MARPPIDPSVRIGVCFVSVSPSTCCSILVTTGFCWLAHCSLCRDAFVRSLIGHELYVWPPPHHSNNTIWWKRWNKTSNNDNNNNSSQQKPHLKDTHTRYRRLNVLWHTDRQTDTYYSLPFNTPVRIRCPIWASRQQHFVGTDIDDDDDDDDTQRSGNGLQPLNDLFWPTKTEVKPTCLRHPPLLTA